MIHSVSQSVSIQLTDAQWSKLNTAGTNWVSEADDDAVGIVKRLGLSTFRIAMVLTVIRTLEAGPSCSPILRCADEDFDTALQLAEVYRAHGLQLLNSPSLSTTKRHAIETKAEQIQKALALQAQGRSVRQIGTELGVPHPTVFRWIQGAGKAAL